MDYPGAVLSICSDTRTTESSTSGVSTGARLTRLQSGNVVVELEGASCANTGSAALLSDGSGSIVALNTQPAIFGWNFRRSQAVMKSKLTEPVGVLCFAGLENYVIGGMKSGRLNIWNRSSGRLLHVHEAHFRGVSALASTPGSGLFFVSGGEDASIHVWSLASFFSRSSDTSVRPVRSWEHEHSLRITQLAFGQSGVSGWVLSVSLDGFCKFLDVPTGRVIASIRFPCGLECCARDPADSRVVLGGQDGRVFLLECFETLPGADAAVNAGFLDNAHPGGVTAVAFSHHGARIVTGGRDGSIGVWDVFSRQRTHHWSVHRGRVACLLILDDVTEAEKRFDAVNELKAPSGAGALSVHVLARVQTVSTEDLVSVPPLLHMVSSDDFKRDEEEEMEDEWAAISRHSEFIKNEPVTPVDPSPSVSDEAASLREEVERLKESNAKLYAFAVRELGSRAEAALADRQCDSSEHPTKKSKQ